MRLSYSVVGFSGGAFAEALPTFELVASFALLVFVLSAQLILLFCAAESAAGFRAPLLIVQVFRLWDFEIDHWSNLKKNRAEVAGKLARECSGK